MSSIPTPKTRLAPRFIIPLYLAIAFAMSWFPWYAGLGPEVFNLGPSLAALVVVLLYAGRPGLRRWFRSFRGRKAAWGIGIAAFLGPAVLYLVGIGAHFLVTRTWPSFLMIRTEMRLLPLYLLLVLAPWQGPVGEEFGWRGFLLPVLQRKLGPFIASLTVGLVWGIWHLPTFFDSRTVLGNLVGQWGFGLFLVVYTLGTMANSIIMTWLYNKSGGSLLIAGILWHAATNFWAPVLLSDSSLTAARSGGALPTITGSLYAIVLGVQVLFGLIVIAATRGRLGSRQPDKRETVWDIPGSPETRKEE